MPVTYDVDSNYLTNPPSHYPRVKPIDTLDIDDLARQINIHNPNMPVNSILAVLNLFIEEVQFQLTEGNWVKLENFCSFATSITNAVLANPSDPLPAGYKIEVKAKPAAPFKQSIRDAASVTRDGIIAKTPEISSAFHSLYELQNHYENGYGLEITGKFLNFDPTDANQGVFIQPQDAAEQRVTNITRNKPSDLIVIPNVIRSSNFDCASILTVRTKYTENGQLKEGVFTKKIRLPNEFTTLDSDVVAFQNYAGDSEITIDDITTDGSYLMRARISNLNVIYMAGKQLVGGVWGDWGAETEITGTGDFNVAVGALTVGVAIDDYDNLFTLLNAEGRYMTELIHITTP